MQLKNRKGIVGLGSRTSRTYRHPNCTDRARCPQWVGSNPIAEQQLQGVQHPQAVRPGKYQASAATDYLRGREQKMGERKRINEREEEDDELERPQGFPLSIGVKQRGGAVEERQGCRYASSS